MSTRDKLGTLYPFVENAAWEHLDRNVTIRDDDGNRVQVRVHATAPCSGCITKMHLDLRLRCICPDGRNDRCIQAEHDKDACISIPPLLLGAAQIISRFGAPLQTDAKELLRAASEAAEDNDGQLPEGELPFPRAALLRFCRRVVVLEEAELALRACITEEHRALLSKDVDEHQAVLRAEAIAQRRVAVLHLEMLQRQIDNRPMPRPEFERRLSSALPEYELNSAVYTRLENVLRLITDHDFNENTVHDLYNYETEFRNAPPEDWDYFFSLAHPYWSDAGAALLATNVTGPPYLRSRLPRRGGGGGGRPRGFRRRPRPRGN
ncbi:hypothetical protein GGR50DRAFT_699071 [Xylaria sp. CBS 124048]|nr:hypothetical protein GGR50DRAFT_699071 [Xylaria sp. CBS 124048]